MARAILGQDISQSACVSGVFFRIPATQLKIAIVAVVLTASVSVPLLLFKKSNSGQTVDPSGREEAQVIDSGSDVNG